MPKQDGIPLARYLADSGLTDGEIAKALGIDIADVHKLPELAGVELGTAHVSRLERSLYESALPGVTWSEKATPAGDVVRLEAYRPPDTAAARTLLAAHDRKYSGQGVQGGTHQSVIFQVASDPGAVASLRSLLGLDRQRVPSGSPGRQGEAGGGFVIESVPCIDKTP